MRTKTKNRVQVLEAEIRGIRARIQSHEDKGEGWSADVLRRQELLPRMARVKSLNKEESSAERMRRTGAPLGSETLNAMLDEFMERQSLKEAS